MDAANGPALPEPPGPAGELAVRRGPAGGGRSPIRGPVTLIGQAPGCDVRLTAEGVEPLHCAIFAGPDGLVLRDLDTPGGTRVNGEAARACRLRDGDSIEVGPFALAVSLSAAPSTSQAIAADAALLGREREALQVQLSAVAAQHAALTEEELRLAQRAAALERQEGQLAAHLEERQRRLDGQQQQARAEYEAAAQDRAAALLQKEESQRAAAELAAQRSRVADLRRKLVKRYRRHWDRQEAEMKRREAEVAARAARLERERATVRAFHEKVNGELELGRRQLRQEWQELGLAQQQWEEALNAERAEQRRRRSELDGRAARVQAAEQALAEQQRQARDRLAALAREADALDVRARKGRARLDELRREVAQLEARLRPGAASEEGLAGVLTSPAPTSSAPPFPRELEEIAGEVRDQRAHLREQWQRLLATQEGWQRDRAEALAELAPVAAELERREQGLAAEARRLAALQAALAQERGRLEDLRGAVEGQRARLAAQEAAWQAERGRLLVQVESRERQVEVRGRLLMEVQKRQNRQREQQRAALREAKARCELARQGYVALWQECELLRAGLARQERTLAGKALALERYRQELVHRASDSPAAESRLARLEKREQERLAEESRAVRMERRALLREAGRVEEQARGLLDREAKLGAREEELDRRGEQAEARRAAMEAEGLRRGEEALRLRGELAVEERQRRQLRDEIERLARSLIEEGEASPAAVPRAA